MKARGIRLEEAPCIFKHLEPVCGNKCINFSLLYNFLSFI